MINSFWRKMLYKSNTPPVKDITKKDDLKNIKEESKNDSKQNAVEKVKQKADGIYRSGEELLKEYENITKKIKRHFSVSDEYFSEHHREVIRKFLFTCQGYPASKSHHHSHLDGLIEHSLEVALYALRRAEGVIFCPSSREEKMDEEKEVFLFSVLVAALLHDAGKSITDNQTAVKLNDSEAFENFNLLLTQPVTGAEFIINANMRNNKMISSKNSHLHANNCLLNRIVSARQINWILSASPELLIELLGSLAGDSTASKQILPCVISGDMLSVAIDVGEDSANSRDMIISALAEILKNPENHDVKINYGLAIARIKQDLIYFVADPTINLVRAIIKNTHGINLPSSPEKFRSKLCDDNIITLAPSGDSMFWLKFIKADGTEYKEVPYLAVDRSLMPEDLELDEFDGKFEMSSKTKGSNPLREEVAGRITEDGKAQEEPKEPKEPKQESQPETEEDKVEEKPEKTQRKPKKPVSFNLNKTKKQPDASEDTEEKPQNKTETAKQEQEPASEKQGEKNDSAGKEAESNSEQSNTDTKDILIGGNAPKPKKNKNNIKFKGLERSNQSKPENNGNKGGKEDKTEKSERKEKENPKQKESGHAINNALKSNIMQTSSAIEPRKRTGAKARTSDEIVETLIKSINEKLNQQNQISYNRDGAAIHIIEEGIAITSPIGIKQICKLLNWDFETTKNAIASSSYVLLDKKRKSIHELEVTGPHRKSTVNAMIISGFDLKVMNIEIPTNEKVKLIKV